MLERIQKENDIKKIDKADLGQLAQEIREFLIDKISKTGGHLAPNLGVVELTMALHLTFDLPEDKIIWDVGHQSYTHKILTGRCPGFDELRQYGGMSGFPKPRESASDAFGTGHSSTAISAGLGYVQARDLRHEDYRVVSVIGDGALTGGMAYEGLNNASQVKSNFTIVLNDNDMSISRNVGGISTYLNKLRSAKAYTGLKKGVQATLEKVPVVGDPMIRGITRAKNSLKQLFIPGMFFEDMGVVYLGPVDGHDLNKLCRVLKEAQKIKGAVLVHVITRKGKGYEPAEKEPWRFHGIGPFDVATGKSLPSSGHESYGEIFGKVLCDEAEKDPSIVAITAAMEDGTSLYEFHKRFPDRFFDVGIAEEHAVTFSAGLAAGGMKPVFAVYSSFLQRGYDQLLHDVALQNLPVVFAVDRAGLVGADGETHQGIFDLSYLNSIPNLVVMSPKNRWELADMLRYAFTLKCPVAIRYPRGSAYEGLREFRAPLELGRYEWIYKEKDIALLPIGHMMAEAVEIREMLKAKGYHVSLINARFVKPIDEACLREIAAEHDQLFTLEENVITGGFGSRILQFVNNEVLPVHVSNLALLDAYVEHGNVGVLRHELHFDAPSLTGQIVEIIEKSRKRS